MTYCWSWRIENHVGKWVVPLLLAFSFPLEAKADDTWAYAVQISAETQVSPPRITLKWQPDRWGVNTFTLYRKSRDATSWGNPITTVPGNVLVHHDDSVQVGATYEYQVVKDAVPGYKGYGYIYTGIHAPLVDRRGKLILVVERNATAGLEAEIKRLQSDLVGDGWEVIRFNVSSNDSPESVKALILNTYHSDPANVNTVFLLGHVPVLHSGSLDWDTHGLRPLPADTYYAHVNGDWPPPPGPSYVPSEARLMVGRVDFFAMPGVGAAEPWPTETEMLRNYLEKDHRWRHKRFTVPRRALMGNLRGDEGGGAPAASGYRSFEPLVGPGNITEANVSYFAPDSERWISVLSRDAYLWAYGCGGGSPNGCGGLGTNIVGGIPGYLYSKDVLAVDAKAVFVMLFGSAFGDWDLPDNLLRTFLATRSYGLAAMMSGRPHWFMHHMGLGEPIGYSARLTMNNSTLYQNQSNGFPRAVYTALMGDPALRMEPIAPPSGLSALAGRGTVTLNWSPSSESVAGYHVYRSASPEGPFSRITTALFEGAAFTDTAVSLGSHHYMVRAVALQVNPSGSYYNPSQGVFTMATVTDVGDPSNHSALKVFASKTAEGIRLYWAAQQGLTYRVLASDDLSQPDWRDLSGTLTSSGPNLSWTDSAPPSRPTRLYRIISP